MKLIFKVFAGLALIALAQAASSTWGQRGANDTLIVSEKVFKPALANEQMTFFVEVPRSGSSNTRIITAIYVQDQFRNSSGATNAILYGGVGWTFATIQVRSLSSKGIDSNVIVYAKEVLG